jgi:hypothetical protein
MTQRSRHCWRDFELFSIRLTINCGTMISRVNRPIGIAAGKSIAIGVIPIRTIYTGPARTVGMINVIGLTVDRISVPASKSGTSSEGENKN